ncbi:MAG TPA: thioesterase family protein, partial [Terriglobales bacterium]|nr:thioesterase family protein [Terriglobales bacterium]
CDACTNALFAYAGLPKPLLLQRYGIAGIPLVESRALFLLPSQFGDTLTAESSISEWGQGSFSVRHRLLKTDALAAEIIEKRVWVVRTGDAPIRFKSVGIPQEVKARFNGRAAAGTAGDQ